ncbi:MAG TPA: antibiotic biosynthesis monooxygenase [Candidatus Copromorpha excrementigallinarum]|uniref:Antibiotic biosynthesis monooxygenase n=1 Tax=Candidatus Allocopromorpha excrementigallinarum TaxID=2840742 RepID=A0A9D1I168_9FIRM|nr:antibiotic biosynthesis monooxygenase [Candidatus Copromorpha excrementigallinarum]
MTNFYVTYKFRDRETRDAFYREVKESGAPEISRKEDGCIRYDFFYYADEDNKLFLWEQWTSREAQKLHCQQPHFLRLSSIKEKYGVETDIQVEDSCSK